MCLCKVLDRCWTQSPGDTRLPLDVGCCAFEKPLSTPWEAPLFRWEVRGVLGSGWLEGDQAGLGEGGRQSSAFSNPLVSLLVNHHISSGGKPFPPQAQVYADGLGSGAPRAVHGPVFCQELRATPVPTSSEPRGRDCIGPLSLSVFSVNCTFQRITVVFLRATPSFQIHKTS